MKAIILARVSTEEQKEAGNSLPAQVDRLKRYCQSKKIEVAKVFSFDESAYKTKRDEFDKILDYLKTHKEKIAVCFDKVDRFSRNVFDKRVAILFELAMEDKVELHFASDNLIITPSMSATEKFHFSMNLGLAKYYSDAIGDSVKRAFESKIKRGEWSGKPPLGYINVIDENGKKDIVSDPLRRHFIVKMFDFYIAGSSIRLTAEKLKEMGLRSNSKTPKEVASSMVYHCLRNPFYYGLMRNKGILNPHKYEKLISKDIFDKAQQAMAGYHKKPFKYDSKPYSFKGLIKCANPLCGCTITAETHRGHDYYSCTNSKGIHTERVYIREDDLLAVVSKTIKELKMPEHKIEETVGKLKQLNKVKDAFYFNSIAGLRKEHDQTKKRASNAFDLLADGSITNEIYNNKLKEYQEKLIDLETQMGQYTDADKDFYLNAKMLLFVLKKAAEVFDGSEPATKRQILNFTLQNIKLTGKKIDFELKTPFNRVLEANKCSSMLRR